MRFRVGCTVGMAWLVACSPVSKLPNEAVKPPASSYGSELPQKSLLVHVPADVAFAAVIRRNALDWLRELLADDPVTKADLSRYFTARLGIDFTEISGFALVGFERNDDFDAALYIDVPTPRSLMGPARGVHREVMLVGVDGGGEYVGASVPDGVWIGHERAVRRAIDHTFERGATLMLSEDSEDADILGYLAIEGSQVPSLTTLSGDFGLSHASLIIDSERTATLRIQGKDERIDKARIAFALGLRAALAKAHRLSEPAQGESPWHGAVSLVGYHQLRQFVEAIEPRVEGKTLVSEYHVAPLMTSTVVAFVATMVSAPAVLEALQDQRKTQAKRELGRIADALITYHNATRPAKASPDKLPKIAGMRLSRTPATIPCGAPVTWNEEHMAAWQDMGYAPVEPMRYALSVGHPSAFGRKATADHILVIRAEGDLDCNGVISRFDLLMRLDAQGNLVRAGDVEPQETAK